MSNKQTTTSHTEEHQHPLTPMSVFVKIFVCLIILTILTYTTSLFDFGIMNIVVAMVIAATKASLVVMFFMQLKMDEIGNKVTFVASLVFLTVFILLTGSDLFFRHPHEGVKVSAAAPVGETDQNKLRIATPELIAKGKELFHNDACVTCHGEKGMGDGIAAGALNPKPRNFTSGYWKFGGSPTRVFHTITNGSPGTGMASYAGLSVADRYALVHYVRSFSPNTPADTPEDLKAAGLLGGSNAAAAEKPKQEVPVEVVMENMEVPDQVMMPSGPIKNPDSPGAKIYESKCLACHGVNGMGSIVRAIGVNPPVELMTASWVGRHTIWVDSAPDFERIVSEGYPGRGMPGIAGLTKQELSELHGYARELVNVK